ncbi:hypothetical protein F5Y15DRAFT_131837 [Xylariaceae sp. FL0016]|nr:hypothetical protein F5Y15DRAFT_131837 [Xylariaceae sp. FL0016]
MHAISIANDYQNLVFQLCINTNLFFFLPPLTIPFLIPFSQKNPTTQPAAKLESTEQSASHHCLQRLPHIRCESITRTLHCFHIYFVCFSRLLEGSRKAGKPVPKLSLCFDKVDPSQFDVLQICLSNIQVAGNEHPVFLRRSGRPRIRPPWSR